MLAISLELTDISRQYGNRLSRGFESIENRVEQAVTFVKPLDPTVTGGPLDEPLKLARRVASVVPAVPTTPPSLILEVPPERVGE